MELKGKKILVVGLGMSGTAAVHFLAGRGANVRATDCQPADRLRKAVESLAGIPVELYLGGHPQQQFLSADMIILSPGVPLAIEPLQEARKRGIPVYAEVELACWYLKERIVGVTGSNGKSTSTALAAHILQAAGLEAAACGNIGRPLIDFVSTTSEHRTLVVELSSFQLETIDRFRSHVAVILNVTPDHLDRYADFESYKQAKMRVFSNQTREDYAVVDADEEHAGEISSATVARVFRYSRKERLHDGVCLENGRLTWMREGKATPVFPASELAIKGPHNLANAMAATSIALIRGAEPEGIASGLRTFRPLEHRLEPAGEINGVMFVNDSKATNVDSAAVALQSFDKPLVVIMGGRDKKGDFAALRPLVERHVKKLILIGEAAAKIRAALQGSAPMRSCSSMEEAVTAALDSAAPSEVVLLAPACTSFDWYNNFEERGRHFKDTVRRLSDAGR